MNVVAKLKLSLGVTQGADRTSKGINQFQCWTWNIGAQQAAAVGTDQTVTGMGDRQQTPCDYDTGLPSEIK